jgi:hypothetical protein
MISIANSEVVATAREDDLFVHAAIIGLRRRQHDRALPGLRMQLTYRESSTDTYRASFDGVDRLGFEAPSPQPIT